MNLHELTTFMSDNHIKPEDMAKAAGIDVSTWYRKIQRKGETLTLKEMNRIIKAFAIPIDKATIIFFDAKLA